MTVSFSLNDRAVTFDGPPETPLLWVIRDAYGLTGTKFGCGIAQCGACTIQIDGRTTRSCITPVSVAENQSVTTIEGLDHAVATAVKTSWAEIDVPQCGYCQSGQVMAAIGLLSANPRPSDDEIDRAMNGNICRCATYVRIRQAIHMAATKLEVSDDA